MGGISPKQLRLLEYENPIARKFGSDFFKRVPDCPGIYWFLGRNEEILYVGKAKNLKRRLRSYQQVKPERSSRKLVRLVKLVEQITWKECPSEMDAFLT